jgi:hypothetical protein
VCVVVGGGGGRVVDNVWCSSTIESISIDCLQLEGENSKKKHSKIIKSPIIQISIRYLSLCMNHPDTKIFLRMYFPTTPCNCTDRPDEPYPRLTVNLSTTSDAVLLNIIIAVVGSAVTLTATTLKKVSTVSPLGELVLYNTDDSTQVSTFVVHDTGFGTDESSDFPLADYRSRFKT